MTSRNLTFRRQSGAALALSLMMMAVLTLISVVSMNSTLLEVLMAGNLQFQTRSLLNAENTLVVAEDEARTLNVLTAYDTVGRYDIASDGARDPFTGLSWNSTDSKANGDAHDRYVLEYAGTQPVLGSSGSWGEGGAFNVDIIRVTARSEGTNGAVRVVQSVYVMKSN